MVLSVTLESEAKYDDAELLAWLNHTLQSGFSTVEQTCSGAAYCQLMDLLYPGCIDLQNVKFNVQGEIDMIHNFKLLEGAFVKASMKKTLEIENLVNGNSTEVINLLRWFKMFFEHNFAEHGYNLVVAQGGEILEPCIPKKPRAFLQLESVPGRIIENSQTNGEREVPEFFYSSLALLSFLRKYCPSASASTASYITCNKAKQVLGQKYPNDIVAFCNQFPYCLYMYHEEEKSYVFLIGYFDQTAGDTRVRLLDVIEKTHSTLSTCVVETLKKFQISPANLAAFYSNAPKITELISGLKALNPCTVFLCNLTGVVGQSCHSGITAMELSAQIQELIKEVYQHFPTLPDFLKEQLNNVKEFSLTSLISDCLNLRTTIYKMTLAWSDLVQYFNVQSASSNLNQHICCLLSDETLRVTFLFLSHALKPLVKFQESLDCGKDVRTLLQDAWNLVHVYMSSYLTPKAVEHALKRGHLGSPTKDNMVYLPRDKVKVANEVVEYLNQNNTELTGSKDLFYQNAVTFYTAVSTSIVKSLPIPDAALKNIAALLSPEGKLEITAKAVSDLSVHFGLCKCGEDVSLLTDEFLDYQFAEQEDVLGGPAVQSLDLYWKMELRLLGKASLFRKLILSLLALPKTLTMKSIFAQVFAHVDHCTDGNEKEVKTEISEDKDSMHNDDADGDVTDTSSYKSAQSHPVSPEIQENSNLEVIDLTKGEGDILMETNASASGPDMMLKKKNLDFSEQIIIDGTDEDDDDTDDDDKDDSDTGDVWTDISYPEKIRDNISSTTNKEIEYSSQDRKPFIAGEMVWGKVNSLVLIPGLVYRWTDGKPQNSIHKVVWFGDGMVSKVYSDALLPYAAFAQCFCPNSFATVTAYKDAIFHSLQVAAKRAEKAFSLTSDSKDDLLRVMLDWAFGGFEPSGPKGLGPRSRKDECLEMYNWSLQKWYTISESDEKLEKLYNLKEMSVCLKRLPPHMQNGRVLIKNEHVNGKISNPKSLQSSMPNEKKYSLSAGRPAPRKRRGVSNNKEEQSLVVQKKPDYSRHQMAHEVLVKGRNIEDFCLSCGSAHIEIFHPLFKGSLCFKCKNNFTETLYRYDEDGYQSYCTVCCAGLEIILCGHDSCSRSFCVDCLDILIGEGTFNHLKNIDPWICYLCAPEKSSGALRPRHDWSIRVQEFFANNSAMEFEPHRVYPSIPAKQRRPIRVLSLFDGIGTGYLVLKDLGFKVEIYVASEIDDESITVSMVNHSGKITHVSDVREITEKHIEKWGPFDLLIGGSPCNDLSVVNPARKGLFEGTGRLFFEYYRLLNIMKPKEDDPRLFFWLFENVVFMNTSDKVDICRFLECNPVLVNAVKVSPAHRARYFWGNLPGMNRPIIASQNDKLALQECLEPGRTAKYMKVRTITTRTNSLKQGNNDQHFPVSMNGKDDCLWVTELETIFGFPKHYTDVKNMSRMQRQKALGKSWSVPVIRHLFAPLKDYFACDEMPLK